MTKHSLASALVTLCLGSAAVGCGDDTGSGGDDAAVTPENVTFTELYDEVFFKRCADSACHGGGGGGAAMLDFSTRDRAYASLVDAAAAGPECGGSPLLRVEPGNAEESLLHDKLSASPSCGRRMPLGSSLDAETRARVDAWINAGAHDD